jgi:hypothetical protein
VTGIASSVGQERALDANPAAEDEIKPSTTIGGAQRQMHGEKSEKGEGSHTEPTMAGNQEDRTEPIARGSPSRREGSHKSDQD